MNNGNKALRHKFSKQFVPGTRVTLAGGKQFTIESITRDRNTVKLEGLQGVFMRAQIINYTNR